MPSRNQHAAQRASHLEPAAPIDLSRASADRLYRTATESVRQRERYARLVDGGADELEQRSALSVACLCDEILREGIRGYEKAVASDATRSTEDWWHRANALWHACREYERRHQNCDEQARAVSSRKPDKLGELALEFDLEASAILALRLALAAYRKASPGCSLDIPAQTIVA